MPDIDPLIAGYDAYNEHLFAVEDDVLVSIRTEAALAGLPEIHVAATEGKLLHILALSIRAERILEIGALGGYSATWLARALPAGGKLVSLEIDAHHADVSRINLQRAGLADLVEVRLGPARESLDSMLSGGEEPFDIVFIDADKESYPQYLERAVPLTRDGGLILADNTLKPTVLDPATDIGITRYAAAASQHPDLVSVIIPVLRDGDHIDGLLVSVKTSGGNVSY
ncbi:MAG: O-methyltransferase [Capsulimonadaceae bacterium]